MTTLIANEVVVRRVEVVLRFQFLHAIPKFVDLATGRPTGLLATVPVDEIGAEQTHQRPDPTRVNPIVFMNRKRPGSTEL